VICSSLVTISSSASGWARNNVEVTGVCNVQMRYSSEC
jgi:hypothetical protein